MLDVPILAARDLWIAWAGMETDLIFNRGVDLPSFAAFPMVDSADGRRRLADYWAEQIGLGREYGVGVILDTPTWMANPDRAAPLGYRAEDLPRLTREAVRLAQGAALRAGDGVRVSVQIGPRGDGYQPGIRAAEESQLYHAPQVIAAAEAGAELVSAYTLGAAGEAIGIARAARQAGIAALVSFTVETDGALADGTPLASAVRRLAEAAMPAAIMVNCAHPEHVERALDGGSWQRLLGGIVANASRRSHAELDEADTLDDGDPEELGQQLAGLRERLPGLRVLGGCCGTDLRHLRSIARHVAPGVSN